MFVVQIVSLITSLTTLDFDKALKKCMENIPDIFQ